MRRGVLQVCLAPLAVIAKGAARPMNPEEYPKLAAVEDRMWFFNSLHLHIEGALVRALNPGGSADILDAGCGTGGLVVRLRQRHPDWSFSAIDRSSIGCELARSRTGLDVKEGDLEALPWGGESFDAVVCADVLSHVESPQKSLKELFRVLRPGGLLVVNVPAYPWFWSHYDELQQRRCRFVRAELRATLVSSGFRGVQVTHWNSLPFPFIWLKRKLMRPDDHLSELRMHSWPVEALMNAAMRCEHAWLQFGGRWSWGASIFVVARKPLAEERL